MPTYVGLRLLLKSVAGSESTWWLSQVIERKAGTRKRGRYFPFVQLKAYESDGSPSYRALTAASPTSALSEAWALAQLANDEEFSPHPSAYSYRWPHTALSSRTYEFYRPGYRERLEVISAHLRKMRGRVVLCADIKSFYGSVNTDHVLSRFRDRVSRSLLSPEASNACVSVAEKLARASNGAGLPIGPAFSHFLANYALETLDATLGMKVGEAYTRYVDDIVIVAEREAVDGLLRTITRLLAQQGLSLHPGKVAVLSDDQWLKASPVEDEKYLDASRRFDDLLAQLVLFAAWRIDELEALETELKSLGFTLPFRRLRAQTDFRKLRWYGARLKLAARLFGSGFLAITARQILNEAVALRKLMSEQLSEIMKGSDGGDSVVSRRFFVQKVRFYASHLLYMLPPSDYGPLLEATARFSELADTSHLVKALIVRSPTDILLAPGPVVSAFASIMIESGVETVDCAWSPELPQEAFDSICTLALYGLCLPPSEWIDRQPQYSRSMIDFCKGTPIGSRLRADFSYIDELRSLQIGSSAEEMSSFLWTRFDDRELISLEALDVGDHLSPYP